MNDRRMSELQRRSFEDLVRYATELTDRVAQLEEALRLCAAGCDIAIQDQQARIDQLEETLRYARWVIESYTAGQEKYLAPIDAALSREPSEAPQKDRCQCQSDSSALGQCKLEVGHTEDCAFEFAEAPQLREEDSDLWEPPGE